MKLGTETVTVRSYISGGRWHGLKQFLYDAALAHGLELKIIDEDKGWFTHTILFSLTGPKRTIRACDRGIHASLQEYNEATA
jgi:hypothetical protein